MWDGACICDYAWAQSCIQQDANCCLFLLLMNICRLASTACHSRVNKLHLQYNTALLSQVYFQKYPKLQYLLQYYLPTRHYATSLIWSVSAFGCAPTNASAINMPDCIVKPIIRLILAVSNFLRQLSNLKWGCTCLALVMERHWQSHLGHSGVKQVFASVKVGSPSQSDVRCLRGFL